MHEIRAGGEVRALIGVENLGQLQEDASAQHECWQCGREGRITEPTSIAVFAHRVFGVVKVAHAACADSQIIEFNAATIRTAARLTAARRHGQQALGAGRQLRRGEKPPGKSTPTRPPLRSLPPWRSGSCCCAGRGPGGGYLAGVGSPTGKRYGRCRSSVDQALPVAGLAVATSRRGSS